MRQDFTSFKEKSARHRWRHRRAAGVWRQSDEYQPGESREQVRDLGSLAITQHFAAPMHRCLPSRRKRNRNRAIGVKYHRL